MKKLTLKTLIIFFAITLLGVSSIFSQETISAEKRTLIQEVMELTNTVNLGVKTEFKVTDFQDSLLAMIAQDKELDDSQRLELKKIVSESNERITKQIQDFNEDKNNSSDLLKEVNFRFYDKTFTENELKELVVFYRTPTGQKSAKFMMSFVNQLSQQYGEIYNQRQGFPIKSSSISML